MIGETAQLITELLLKDQLSSGVATAESKLGGLNTTAGKTGAATSLASRGLANVESAAKKVGGAMSHAAGQIGGLVSNLGLFGGAAGLLGIAGAATAAVSKVEAVGNAAYAMSQKTGQSVESMSALLAVTGKLGIAESSVSSIAGMYEKMVGKLAMTTASATKVQASAHTLALEQRKLEIEAVGGKTTAIAKLITEAKAQDVLNAAQVGGLAAANKLVALQDQYKVTLTDSKGQALGFSDALLNVADAYTKATTASDKARVAALASQVFGRGYQTLTPYLSLGRQGILDAQAEAAQMGEVLTAQNVQQLAALRNTQRTWNATLSGLEIQAGLTIIPMLTDIGNAANKYLGDPTNRASLLGALKSIESIAGSVGSAIATIGGAIAGIWGKIPGPMQQLLISGFVANKAAGWLFGTSLVGGVKGLLGGLLGSVPGVGAAADTALGVTHVWVDNMGAGGLGGAGGGAATAAEDTGLATVGNVGGLGAIGGALTLGAGAAVGAVAVDQYMNTSNQAGAIATQTGAFVKTATLAQLTAARQSVADAAKQLIGQSWNPFAPAAEGGLNDTLKQLNAAIDARTSHVGGTGGNVGQDVYPVTLSATGAGVMARAVANGLEPTKTGIAATMARNSARLIAVQQGFRDTDRWGLAAIEAAVNRTTQAINLKQFIATGILGSSSLTGHTPTVGSRGVSGGTGGNVGGDAYPLVVKVQVSNRQNETASAYSNRYGPTPVHQGAQ